jgi:nucleoside-diphosphate-sugar epimerase
MSRMRIFLAGGTGVVGRRIVPLLLERDHDVTVMARNLERAAQVLPDGVQVVSGDVFDADRTREIVNAAEPDVIIHQLTDLASGDSSANARMRIDGTRSLVDAALDAGVGRILAQSIAWGYGPGEGPATEEEPLDEATESPERLATVAAISALEAEAQRLPQSVVLRNGIFYGPGTWHWPGGLFAELARGGLLPATPGVTSFVHVDDAARAAVDALEWPTGSYNVVDDEPAAGQVWLPQFARVVGAPEPAVSESSQRWERGASNRLARSLGWEPRWPSWRAGFAAATPPDE